MLQQKKFTQKKNYELKRILGSSPTATGAIFVSRTNPKDRLLVRFTDFIDATETGKAIGMTGNFNVGFDAKEDTGEPSAFPRQVRDFLVRGYSKDGKITPGIGNRTQATGVVFNIFDKGYAGDFYGITSQSCKTPKSDAATFMIGGEVRSLEKGCNATISIKPDFSDTYDLYFINHGNKSVKMDVDMMDDVVLPAEKTFASTKEFILIGSYYFDNNRTSSITIRAVENGISVEGIVLVKRNSQYPPIISVKSLTNDTFNIQSENRNAANATLYVRYPKGNRKEKYSITVNKLPFTMKNVAENTVPAVNVSLPQGGNAGALK